MLVRFTGWSPSKGDPPGDALAFDDRDDRVRLDLLKGVRMPTGPPDFQSIGSKRRSQAEMDAGVVLTQVAGAGFDLANLRARPDGHEHSGADGVAVAPRPDQTKLQRVVAVAAVVPQEIGRLTVVGHQHIEIPVIVDIRDCERPADLLGREAAARRTTLLDEAAAIGVVEQQPALCVFRAGANL